MNRFQAALMGLGEVRDEWDQWISDQGNVPGPSDSASPDAQSQMGARCPRCSSPNIAWRPGPFGSINYCKDCGYQQGISNEVDARRRTAAQEWRPQSGGKIGYSDHFSLGYQEQDLSGHAAYPILAHMGEDGWSPVEWIESPSEFDSTCAELYADGGWGDFAARGVGDSTRDPRDLDPEYVQMYGRRRTADVLPGVFCEHRDVIFTPIPGDPYGGSTASPGPECGKPAVGVNYIDQGRIEYPVCVQHLDLGPSQMYGRRRTADMLPGWSAASETWGQDSGGAWTRRAGSLFLLVQPSPMGGGRWLWSVQQAASSSNPSDWGTKGSGNVGSAEEGKSLADQAAAGQPSQVAGRRRRAFSGDTRPGWCPMCESEVTWVDEPLNYPAPGIPYMGDHWVCPNGHEATAREIEAWAQSRVTAVRRQGAKISGDDLEKIRAAVAPLDTPETRARYLSGDYPRADRTKDIDMRYRWDLLWAAGLGEHITKLYDDGVYDSHIDTALRNIVPKLGRRRQGILLDPTPVKAAHVTTSGYYVANRHAYIAGPFDTVTQAVAVSDAGPGHVEWVDADPTPRQAKTFPDDEYMREPNKPLVPREPDVMKIPPEGGPPRQVSLAPQSRY